MESCKCPTGVALGKSRVFRGDLWCRKKLSRRKLNLHKERKRGRSSGRGFGVLPVAAGSRVCGKYQRVLSGRVGGNLAGEVKILH